MLANTTLADLAPGQRATVRRLELEGGIRRRLLDIGLTEGAEVECAGSSPFGSPSGYLICGALIAIRQRDGKKIIVERKRREIAHGTDQWIHGQKCRG